MNGCVYQPSRIIEEERLGFVLSQKGEGILAGLMIRKTVLIQPEGIFFFRGGKPRDAAFHGRSLAPTASGPVETLVFGLREGLVIDRHMPFSGVAGRVSVTLKNPGDGSFVFRHPATVPWGNHGPGQFVVRCGRRSSHDMGLLSPSRVVAAHDGATAGSAGRSRRIGLPEQYAPFGKRIKVGCFHYGWFVHVVAFDVLPAQIVSEDEHDVGFGRSLVRLSQVNQKSRKDDGQKKFHRWKGNNRKVWIR